MSALTIVHVSDTHLSRKWAYFQDNWEAFLDCMREERPDFIFVTGDMCFNGAKAPDDLVYAREQMARLPVPWRAIPGNHDIGDTPPDPRLKGPITVARRTRYRRAFGPDFWVQDLDAWRFVGLNAQLLESGLAAEKTQIKMLRDALAAADDRSVALLIHKPLFLQSPGETGDVLSNVWPRSRKRLLALCEKYRVTLVASGHRHCYRSMRHGSTLLIFATPTSFINTRATGGGPRVTRRVGYIRYRFDGKRLSHEFVEPPLFINHDMRNWMAAHGSTTRLPPRPLTQHK
ncbi:MAG: metallophosphoesterase [Rhodospirillaceae bacterium]|nr:metallophosphoesterase [Rhodospirillaceae bacterium]